MLQITLSIADAPLFIPMEQKAAHDLHQSHAGMIYPQYASVLEAEYTPGQIILYLSLDFVVGMLAFSNLAALEYPLCHCLFGR